MTTHAELAEALARPQAYPYDVDEVRVGACEDQILGLMCEEAI